MLILKKFKQVSEQDSLEIISDSQLESLSNDDNG